MRVEKLDLREAGAISGFCLDYLDGKKELEAFYGLAPSIASFKEQLSNKQFPDENRKVLCQVLESQYSNLNRSDLLQENLSKLSQPNTFTVTTGHQCNIFTGPLYFLYKIITVTDACRQLKSEYPDYNFVPVYWMASEDHDFDEINHFNLFGKKYTWETDQKGAVGRFDTSSMSTLLEELPEKVELFEKAYREHDKLADAVRYYVNELFGEDGVVVIDADDHDLKGLFHQVIKDDVFNHTANDLVERASEELSQLGYKTQIFPRKINFFYLEDGLRERIVRDGEKFKVNNTNLSFSKEEISELIENQPERFSPNVVLRPLYQETILPNLAYVGGPAEVVYWLQLKEVFDHFSTPFPILMPRNFAMYVNGGIEKKIKKFELSYLDLFKSEQELKQDFMAKNAENEISLNGEVDDLKRVYDLLAEKAAAVDGSLKGFIGSEFAKAAKGLDNIEKRLKKAEERKHETSLNQLSAIKGKLFPNGSLQERSDNFLNFAINNPNFVNEIKGAFDAFDFKMHVVVEE